MWFRKKKKAPQAAITRGQSLEYVPVRNVEVVEEADGAGNLVLNYPLVLKPIFVSVAKRFNLWRDDKPMTRKLQLDSMGKATWELIDGKRTVEQIINDFAKQYQVLPREAEMAMASFLRELGRRGLIAFKEK